MNRSINIFLYQSFTKKNSILVVITFPSHETNQWIFTKCDFSTGSRRSVCNNLTLFYYIAFLTNRTLVHTGSLVTTNKLRKFVLIFVAVCFLNHNAVRLCSFYHTAFFGNDTVS